MLQEIWGIVTKHQLVTILQKLWMVYPFPRNNVVILPMLIVGVLALYLVWNVSKQVSFQDNSTEFQIKLTTTHVKEISSWKIQMYIASVLKDETDIITSIAARPIGRDVILVIMHAITFKAAAIFSSVLQVIMCTFTDIFQYQSHKVYTSNIIQWDRSKHVQFTEGPSWSCSYVCWIYNDLCNQWLPPLWLWVRTPLMARCTRYNIM
jgi:hypothetical protein